MFDKENFTPDARAALIKREFQKAARKCGGIAQKIDGDMSESQLAETRQMAVYLIAELQAMIARPTKDSRR